VLAVPRRALPCKKEICTRLFQPDFVALLMYRSIGRSPAIRSISFKCCSKATDFGWSQSAAQVLGVKPSVASAGSDLDFDNAFATVMQQTGPAIGACVITDQSSCDFLARERSAMKISRRSLMNMVMALCRSAIRKAGR
jgi:hypothetical protein